MISADADDGMVAIAFSDGNASAVYVGTEAEVEKFWSDLGRLLNKMEDDDESA